MADSIEGSDTALRRIALAISGGQDRLSLAGLGLEALPPQLRPLTGIRVLDLSGNRITELPVWIGRLTALEELSLRGNRLVALPESLSGLTRLKRLDLADNQFVEIPRWLGRLDLVSVGLEDNECLLVPPPQVVAEGTEAVLEHLRRRDSQSGGARTITLTAAESAPGTAAGTPSAAGTAPAAPVTAANSGPPSVPRSRSRAAAIGIAVVLLAGAVVGLMLHNAGGPATAAAASPADPTESASALPSSSPSALGYSTAPFAGSLSGAPSTQPAAKTPTAAGSPDASASASATPTPAASPRVGVVTGFGGLCLDDANARTVSGNQVDVFTCNGSNAQKWTVTPADDTVRVLGMCLDVQGGATADGTTVVLNACDKSASQEFVPRGNGSLYNVQSGRCLDDPNSSTTPRTVVQIWQCTGNGNQKWDLPS